MSITLTAEYRKAQSARAVPGSVFNRESKAWEITNPTPRAASVALKLFPELAMTHPELTTLRDKMSADVRPFDNPAEASLRISDTIDPPAGLTYYEYQDLDFGYLAEIIQRHGGAYLGHERGLGKTLGGCSIIEATGADRTLVVCPNTAKGPVWAAELARFLPDRRVVVLPNEKAKREKTLEALGDGPLVLVVHYEALAIIAKQRPKDRGWDAYGEWDLVIADEAHRLKNPKAKMVKAIKRIPSRMRLALSGSIIENHAEELFSPLQWLFPDRYKSRWRDWNDRFIDYVEGPFGKICVGVKPERLPEMQEELGIFMAYRRKEDELDLPPRTEQTLLVDLSPGQRRAYEELRETCVATLDNGDTITAEDGLPMLGRLRQVATGLDLVGGVEDSTKIDTALELITDNEDEAFVVFTWYKAAAHSIAKQLEAKGVAHYVVTGDVPHTKRAEYIQAFQAGERRVFIGTIATLGESVNLHRATNAIFLDRSWNPMDNAQAADRIYRIGQTKPVTVTHLVAKDTVDELRVQPALASKEALRAAILGGSNART